MTTCNCPAVETLVGDGATAYARAHLTLERTEYGKEEWWYVCPITQIRFILSFPQLPIEQRGLPRLRRYQARNRS